MNNFFTQLQKEARMTRLLPREKQAMRVALYEAMQKAPADAFAPAREPHAVKSPYHWYSPRIASVFALLFLVMLGGGTAYAAQGSLPGEPLFAVKVSVNEPLEGALKRTPQAQAQWNADIAQRRLEEAETLAAAGKLTATTSAEIASNFDTHVKEAQTITEDIATQDPQAAAQLAVEFDSSISAHSAILAQIGDDSGDTQTKEDSNTLAEHARLSQRGRVVAAAAVDTPHPETFATRASEFKNISSSTPTTTPTEPPLQKDFKSQENWQGDASLEAKASSTIALAEQDFAAIQNSLDASTTLQVQNAFDAITADMDAGNSEMALRAALRLDAYLKAGKRFDKHLLPSLLEIHTVSGDQNQNDAGGNDGSGGDHGGTNSHINNNEDSQNPKVNIDLNL